MVKDAHGLLHRAAASPSGPRRPTTSMAALTVAIVGVLALAGTTWVLRGHTVAPTVAKPSPVGGVSMAPLPPLPVSWKSLTGPQYTVLTARRGKPVRVGLHLGNGRGGFYGGSYVVSQVRIDVLPTGVHPYESVSGNQPREPGSFSSIDNPAGGRFDLGTKPYVRRLVLTNLPSTTNRDVTILFDGTDGQGRPLAAGRYEVGFVLATKLTKAKGTIPAGSANSASGLLVTINYLG